MWNGRRRKHGPRDLLEIAQALDGGADQKGTDALGIIDTLTVAFTSVSKRLWLTLVPIVLDLFLWLGPKLSAAPVVDKLAAMFGRALEAAAAQSAADEAMTTMVEGTISALRETLGRTNLFALLAWGRLGVPSVAGLTPIEPGSGWIIQVSEYWQMLSLQAVIMGAGLLIACAFLVVLAKQAQGEGLDPAELSQSVVAAWFAMVVVFLPIGLFMIFSVSASLLFGPFAIFLGVFLLWVLIYISFVPQAITLGERNPLRALWTSFMVVRHNFWASIGLIVLTNLINTGLGLIWFRLLVGSTVGTLIAIAANAYVGTSLTLAAFVFYRDRVGTWGASIPQQRSA